MRDIKRKCLNQECGVTVVSPGDRTDDGRCPLCGDVLALALKPSRALPDPFRKVMKVNKRPFLTAADLILLREMKISL